MCICYIRLDYKYIYIYIYIHIRTIDVIVYIYIYIYVQPPIRRSESLYSTALFSRGYNLTINNTINNDKYTLCLYNK